MNTVLKTHMKALLFSILSFAAVKVFAADFMPVKSAPQKIACTYKNQSLTFAGSKLTYKFYEKGLEAVKIIGCEKIQVSDQQLYTVTFDSKLKTPAGPKRLLTYEVILNDKKSFQTIRSEIIDEIDFMSDLPSSEFSKSFKAQWGQSAKDKSVMLQLTISEKNQLPFTFLLKLNNKKSWLENVF